MNIFYPTNTVGSCLLIQYANLCPLIGALSLFKAISDKARITSTILKESFDRAQSVYLAVLHLKSFN